MTWRGPCSVAVYDQPNPPPDAGLLNFLQDVTGGTPAENTDWTPHQIDAWTGHESLSEIAHYTRKANRRNLVTRTEQDRNLGNRVVEFSKKGQK